MRRRLPRDGPALQAAIEDAVARFGPPGAGADVLAQGLARGAAIWIDDACELALSLFRSEGTWWQPEDAGACDYLDRESFELPFVWVGPGTQIGAIGAPRAVSSQTPYRQTSRALVVVETPFKFNVDRGSIGEVEVGGHDYAHGPTIKAIQNFTENQASFDVPAELISDSSFVFNTTSGHIRIEPVHPVFQPLRNSADGFRGRLAAMMSFMDAQPTL